jgi:hypothetical protein
LYLVAILTAFHRPKADVRRRRFPARGNNEWNVVWHL